MDMKKERARRVQNSSKRLIMFSFLRISLLILGLAICTMAYSQSNVTIKLSDTTVGDVFNVIKSQTGYTVAYNNSDVDLKKKVSVNVQNGSVNEAVKQALAGQEVAFSVTDNHIVLSKKMAAPTGNKIKIGGKITGVEGEELIGASISEKGTANGTVSDVSGNYNLTVDANAVLEISYIGYLPKEEKVNGRQVVNVTLSEDAHALQEVVVTALGIKRDRKALGYSLEEVRGETMTEARDQNVANLLSGRIAGLQVKQSGTGPTGSSRIILRGNNSLAGNNQPLIVVDGVPIDSSTGGSDDFWGNKNVDRGSGLADVSPDDIESVSVLKGPAAAALYGSRAGNGVIMITTKKGASRGLGISVN